MGMSKQSSKETRGRAKELAEAIGAYHVDLDIDEVYEVSSDSISREAQGLTLSTGPEKSSHQCPEVPAQVQDRRWISRFEPYAPKQYVAFLAYLLLP